MLLLAPPYLACSLSLETSLSSYIALNPCLQNASAYRLASLPRSPLNALSSWPHACLWSILLRQGSSLVPKMHNTAPSPNGIPNQFWKALTLHMESPCPPQAGCVKGQPHLHCPSGPSLPSFWSVFQSLTDDLRAHGTNCCGFKGANLSLFYKKGDPTLVANYCPISSMNCDCKMYTNLINNCLSPWVVAKLHPDQKGFVPRHLITKHTPGH